MSMKQSAKRKCLAQCRLIRHAQDVAAGMLKIVIPDTR